MVIKTLQQLAVPDQKDCIFVSPDYKNWEHLLDENKSSLSKLDNTDISRSQLLSIALKYTQRFGLSVPHQKKHKSIIVTGHQPIWHHCGILAKNIITDRFAQDTGGIAVHLVLDHDICDTAIVLPKYDRSGFLYLEKIQLEQPEPNIPIELRPVPSKEQVNNFICSVSKSNGSYYSGIWRQYSKRILNAIGSFRNVADFVTILQAILNQALGLEMIYLPVSLMSESKCFTNFVSSIICDAVKFTNIYNQGIRNQMQTLNLKPAQTIRPLKIDLQKNVVELPFWLTFSTGQKFPLYVNLEGKNLSFGAASNIVGTLDSSGPDGKKQRLLEIMKTHNCRIRPKAVSLTLFVRLYLADWFVHGVGGGLYEQITDYVIRKYYKVMKLNFGVATATMTLSLEINNQNSHLTDAQLKTRLRELKFNPEKLIDRSILDKPPVKSLLNTKNDLIKTANNPQITASGRKDAWRELSRINKELFEYTGQTCKKMLKETDLWRKYKTDKEVTNCREFFFGLFSEQKLKSLANLEEVENENSLNCCSPSR